jgi:hypothetical protein
MIHLSANENFSEFLDFTFPRRSCEEFRFQLYKAFAIRWTSTDFLRLLLSTHAGVPIPGPTRKTDVAVFYKTFTKLHSVKFQIWCMTSNFQNPLFIYYQKFRHFGLIFTKYSPPPRIKNCRVLRVFFFLSNDSPILTHLPISLPRLCKDKQEMSSFLLK